MSSYQGVGGLIIVYIIEFLSLDYWIIIIGLLSLLSLFSLFQGVGGLPRSSRSAWTAWCYTQVTFESTSLSFVSIDNVCCFTQWFLILRSPSICKPVFKDLPQKTTLSCEKPMCPLILCSPGRRPVASCHYWEKLTRSKKSLKIRWKCCWEGGHVWKGWRHVKTNLLKTTRLKRRKTQRTTTWCPRLRWYVSVFCRFFLWQIKTCFLLGKEKYFFPVLCCSCVFNF